MLLSTGLPQHVADFIPTDDESYDLRHCRLLLKMLYVRYHALGGQDGSLLTLPCALAVAKALALCSKARDVPEEKDDIDLAWQLLASVQVVESLYALFYEDYQTLRCSTPEVELADLVQYQPIFPCPHLPPVFATALTWSVAVTHRT